MLLSFHNAFAEKRIKGSAIDVCLPLFIRLLQDKFQKFVDGGAGVGQTTEFYKKSLLENLNSENHSTALITCYEPLPENFENLKEKFGFDNNILLENCAIAHENGFSSFIVPSRIKEGIDSSGWSSNTSYNGFLPDVNQKNPNLEEIFVRISRLEDSLSYVPDFVKLDLQGGELNALFGMGQLLRKTKVFYIEHQLLNYNNACDYLSRN